MGFHVCEYCNVNKNLEDEKTNSFSHLSSGDVTLQFASGRSWGMPDMILHYVADHHWLPPQQFIDDVMNSTLAGGERLQTKGVQPTKPVGYLHGPFEKGNVPDGFVQKLQSLMKQAAEAGNRRQTRSVSF